MTTAAQPKVRRRWKTISLRGVMVLVVVAAIFLARETSLARRQKHAIDVLSRAGGIAWCDDLVDSEGVNSLSAGRERPGWQAWIMRRLGEDYIRRVHLVQFPQDTPRQRCSEKLGPDCWQALAQLHDLAWLQLGGINVTDPDLAVIGGLRRLRILDLDANPDITDVGLAHLRNLRDLSSIDLSDTAVTDLGIRHLTGCTHLRRLILSQTRVGGGTLALFPHWPELVALDLSDTQVTDEGIPHLLALRRLQELTLYDTQITDVGLAHVAGLTALESLNLQNTPTGDPGVAHLSQLGRLEFLVLGRDVTDASLPVLKSMKKLMTLHVTSSKISPEGARELKQALPSTNIIR